MKTRLKPAVAIFLALFASPLAIAAEHDHGQDKPHEHDENVTKGPNGGLLVKSKAGLTFEVTVDKDRKARIIVLDKDNKPADPGALAVTGIAGERSAPVKLAFAKGSGADARTLVADKALPAGAHVPMILSIKTAPDAKAVTERFELHLH